MKRNILALLFLFASSTVAAEDGGGAKFALVLGFTNGGDEIASATLYNTSTGDTKEENLKAGGEIHFALGTLIQTTPEVETMLTFGYHVDSITAENGDIEFSRNTLEAVPYYKSDQLRLGFGITYHMNTELSASGAAGSGSLDFDNSLGFVMAGAYVINDRARFELRYVTIDYDASDFPLSYDGNHVGLYMALTL